MLEHMFESSDTDSADAPTRSTRSARRSIWCWPPTRRPCRSRSWAGGWWSCRARPTPCWRASAAWSRTFELSGGHEDAGAPTMAAWSRRELRLTPAEARRRTRAGHALDKLPAVRDALFAGQVRMAHVDAIAAGVHRLGPDVIGGFEEVLLDVARSCDPAELRAAVDKVRDVLDPDAADAAHVRAMEQARRHRHRRRGRVRAGRFPAGRHRRHAQGRPLGRRQTRVGRRHAGPPGSAAPTPCTTSAPPCSTTGCRRTAGCAPTCSSPSAPTGSGPPPPAPRPTEPTRPSWPVSEQSRTACCRSWPATARSPPSSSTLGPRARRGPHPAARDPQTAPGDPGAAGRRLREPRLRPHAPGDPPPGPLVGRGRDEPGGPGRLLQPLPPPHPPRIARHPPTARRHLGAPDTARPVPGRQTQARPQTGRHLHPQPPHRRHRLRQARTRQVAKRAAQPATTRTSQVLTETARSPIAALARFPHGVATFHTALPAGRARTDSGTPDSRDVNSGFRRRLPGAREGQPQWTSRRDRVPAAPGVPPHPAGACPESAHR